MAKTLAAKEVLVASLVEGLAGAKSVVLADLGSLKVNETSAFRRKAEKDNIRVFSAKKTLLRRALQSAGKELGQDPKSFPGSVSLLCGFGDEIAPAKILADLRKDKEMVKAFGGLLGTTWMSAAEVVALAKLPGKQELIAQAVGSIAAPLRGFVTVLSGNLRGLVNALNAVKDEKAKA
jgi:large subunit ribosomal protein L10